MNQKMKYITGIVLSTLVICALTIPTFALTESDVQSQVSASGKEGVAGNLFVWFLCAVAFLKISQKIDGFMQGLGINVGHTGGSMLAEVMLAARSIAAARGVAGRGRGGNAGRGGSAGGSSGGGDSNTFLQGGLAGVVNRSFYNGAYKSATGTGSGGVGGMAFRASMTKGGDIAYNVISRIATGGAGSGDVMSGNMAADALCPIWAIRLLVKARRIFRPSPMWRSAVGISPARRPLRKNLTVVPLPCTALKSIWSQNGNTPLSPPWMALSGISSTRRTWWSKHPIRIRMAAFPTARA